MSGQLKISNLGFAYHRQPPILNGLEMVFTGGRITALLGNNGSGKTTLLRILAGVSLPGDGTMMLNGDLIGRDTMRDYKTRIGFMPETTQLYPDMRVNDVLMFFARLKACPLENIDQALEAVGLSEHANKPVRALSKGLRQRLNLAQALLNQPELLILDEPSNGFDYSGISLFYDLLRQVADNGTIVILSSHQLAEIEGRVDDLAILAGGKISKHGPVGELLKSTDLIHLLEESV